jgi:hypothetical protein
VVSEPIGAWRIGQLRLSLSVKALLDHMDHPSHGSTVADRRPRTAAT